MGDLLIIGAEWITFVDIREADEFPSGGPQSQLSSIRLLHGQSILFTFQSLLKIGQKQEKGPNRGQIERKKRSNEKYIINLSTFKGEILLSEADR
jgi:hypothetical protein